MAGIGSLNEKPLHAALKAWCLRPGDRTEVPVDGYVIDVVRGDLLIEVQTRSFSSIRRKLRALSERHPLRLVYPIAQQKWIVKLGAKGRLAQTRRRSPIRGVLLHVFDELVSFPDLLAHPNFSLQVVTIHEEEVRRQDGRRGWRRKGWVTQERRLLHVIDQHELGCPADVAALLPGSLSSTFTTADLKNELSTSLRLAQRMAYCLERMNLTTRIGKRGRSILYERVGSGAGDGS